MSKRLPSFLSCVDQRWMCGGTIELISYSVDPDLTGIGGSPFGGLGTTGVRIPSVPTTDLSKRYLIRLVGVEIPQGFVITIKGLRQAATLRAVQVQEDGSKLVIEKEIVSPFWRFLDGNISWHLRYQKNVFSARRGDSNQKPGTSPDNRGLDSALIYLPPLTPYKPPSQGRPPGDSIDHLGNFSDLRYSWDDANWCMNQIVSGPGSVVLYASVKQTDPSNRPTYPSLPGMRPEDLFVSSFPDSIYGRIAGAMTVELMPCSTGEKK